MHPKTFLAFTSVLVFIVSMKMQAEYKMVDNTEYLSQPKEINTFAGVTSFVLGTMVMENKIRNWGFGIGD